MFLIKISAIWNLKVSNSSPCKWTAMLTTIYSQYDQIVKEMYKVKYSTLLQKLRFSLLHVWTDFTWKSRDLKMRITRSMAALSWRSSSSARRLREGKSSLEIGSHKGFISEICSNVWLRTLDIGCGTSDIKQTKEDKRKQQNTGWYCMSDKTHKISSTKKELPKSWTS